MPLSYGIGPYSGVFWWMMMEWSADRRANWLYHNQARISSEAYADVARDAEVQKRLAALEAQKGPRDSNYVDPEFKEHPTDVYAQKYVEAAYNPVPMQSSSPSWMWTIVTLTAGIGLLGAATYGVFAIRWGK